MAVKGEGGEKIGLFEDADGVAFCCYEEEEN